MKLLESLKLLILERTFLDSFTSNNIRVNVFYNEHSQGIGNVVSSLSRVDKEQILKSLLEIKEIIANISLRILDNCGGKKCSFIIRDYADGVDSHFWIKLSKEGRLNLILNTSINHPKKLFNPYKVPVINVDLSGDTTISESKNKYVVGKKIIIIENL
jgi:hypothetical protein